MKIRNNLTQEEKAWIVSQKWYHQRFDGCPHFLSLIGLAETRKEPRKPPGSEATLRICFYYDGKADWYILEEDNRKTTEIFLQAAQTNPDFTKTMMRAWEKEEKEFYQLCEQIEKADLRSLSDKELHVLYGRFAETYACKVSSSSIIDGFALGSDRVVAERIRAHLQTTGRETEYNALFSILTAPVHISFTNEAEMELLKIALDVEGNPEWKRLFLQYSEDDMVAELVKHPMLYARLDAHQKRFFWLQNNYIDAHVLPLEYFIREIKQRMEEGIDIAHELRFIISHPEENKRKKEEVLHTLRAPLDLIALLRYSEDFTHWQDERKRSTFFTSHYGTLLLDEVARRTGFALEELKQVTPPEMQGVFEGSLHREQVQPRLQGCLVLLRENEVAVVDGTEAATLYEEVKRLDVPKDMKVIKGLSASLGKATGTVRVIKSAREIGKVNSGDILVAVMTRPDYVVGMKKAAAIVTDEGGLTCHAAIVSRELRLPCIIATKFATHVLCDGDTIEVDANTGEVRILKREKP